MENLNSAPAQVGHFNGTFPIVAPATIQKPDPAKNNFPLRLAQEGDSVQIVALSGGKKFHDRLIGVGLRIGTMVKIIRNPMNGKLIIGHNSTRFFIGGGMAHRIQVISIKGAKR